MRWFAVVYVALPRNSSRDELLAMLDNKCRVNMGAVVVAAAVVAFVTFDIVVGRVGVAVGHCPCCVCFCCCCCLCCFSCRC